MWQKAWFFGGVQPIHQNFKIAVAKRIHITNILLHLWPLFYVIFKVFPYNVLSAREKLLGVQLKTATYGSSSHRASSISRETGQCNLSVHVLLYLLHSQRKILIIVPFVKNSEPGGIVK